MEDISPKLFDLLDSSFNKGIKEDATIRNIDKLISKGKATYNDGYLYSQRVAKHMTNSLQKIDGSMLPDGKMYYNISQRTVEPMLNTMNELVSNKCYKIQTSLNKASNLNIKAVKVTSTNLSSNRKTYDTSKINGIIDIISNADDYDSIKYMLDYYKIENLAMSVVDSSIRNNAQQQYDLGMKPTIERVTSGKCCDWCTELAGVYDYPLEDNEVYKRHTNCNCLITYHPINGKIQNVITKDEYSQEEYINKITDVIDGKKVERQTITKRDYAKILQKRHEDYQGIDINVVYESIARKKKSELKNMVDLLDRIES